MVGQVYSKRKVLVPKPMQAQEYDPSPKNEITISNSPSKNESELSLPIVIKK